MPIITRTTTKRQLLHAHATDNVKASRQTTIGEEFCRLCTTQAVSPFLCRPRATAKQEMKRYTIWLSIKRIFGGSIFRYVLLVAT